MGTKAEVIMEPITIGLMVVALLLAIILVFLRRRGIRLRQSVGAPDAAATPAPASGQLERVQ